MTLQSGAPANPYVAGAPSATAVAADGTDHVFYRDYAGGLHELRSPRN